MVDRTSIELRRTMRRELRLPCAVVSHYSDDPALHVAANLSELGMWIETPLPLHCGAELVVCFRPPRWERADLTLFARVRRATTGRRRLDRGPLGMGIEFLDLGGPQRDEVIACLLEAVPEDERITPVMIRRRAA